MKLTRRSFIAASTASLALPNLATASTTKLVAEPVSAQLLPPGANATPSLGFNGSTPGPVLRVKKGAELSVAFENNISEPTSIHWHGIRLQNRMDGVPDLTQRAVQPNGQFDYRFVAPDAGTFWYHSHNRSWEQVARGLYGPLIVEEENPPQVDHDIIVQIDDWLFNRDGTLYESFGDRHEMSHAGRIGNFVRAIPSVEQVKRKDRVRLRLINVATARVFPLRLKGVEGKIVALDGMPLAEPRPIEDLLLAPAQRIDIIADVIHEIDFLMPEFLKAYSLGFITVEGENKNPIKTPITRLEANEIETPDLDGSEPVLLALQGGAMGGRHRGDDIWSFNGISGLADEPFLRLRRGQTAKILISNDTAFPHGMHLHGHHFYELNQDGSLGDLRDTTYLDPDEEKVIVCVFDNPGNWLFHCHMLGHQASGMKTWIEVT